ncbi:hypothetical protein M1719_25275, partial [Salmonella enterica subsp. enterica serovar Give]|nr:hypothetical protein [Salmonella enterica subsp. enterica serovar Give]
VAGGVRLRGGGVGGPADGRPTACGEPKGRPADRTTLQESESEQEEKEEQQHHGKQENNRDEQAEAHTRAVA